MANVTPYVLSSQARDLIGQHAAAFARNDIRVPRPEDFPGEAYLPAFASTLNMLADWMSQNV